MNTAQFFDLKRFVIFLKRQLVVNNRSWLIELGGLTGILLFLTIVQWVTNYDYQFNFFRNVAILSFFAGGIGLTSKSFSELRSPAKALLYMNSPASVFEKLLTNWLIRAIGFAIIMYVIIFIMSIVCGALSEAILGSSWQTFDLFAVKNLKIAGHFLVWQSIFLFGAVYFKNNNLIKTLFSLIGIGLFFSLWTGLIGAGVKELYGIESLQMRISSEVAANQSPNGNTSAFFNFINTLEIVFKWVYVAIAPFFLLVTYFHLKEREF